VQQIIQQVFSGLEQAFHWCWSLITLILAWYWSQIGKLAAIIGSNQAVWKQVLAAIFLVYLGYLLYVGTVIAASPDLLKAGIIAAVGLFLINTVNLGNIAWKWPF
jgi:hypothetical protein